MSASFLLLRLPVLLLIAAWLLDPRTLGYFGYEGLMRWGALLAMIGASIVFGDRSVYRSQLLFWTGMFIAAAALSILITGGEQRQWLELARLGGLVFLPALMVRLQKREQADVLLREVFGLLALVVAASLILSVVADRVWIFDRLAGVTPHPNILVFVAIVVAIWPWQMGWVGRAIKFAAVATVVLTGSLLGGLVVSIWIAARLLSLTFSAEDRAQGFGWAVLSVAWVAMLLPLALAPLGPALTAAFFTSDASSSVRLALWGEALSALSRNPLNGSGFAAVQLPDSLEDGGVLLYSHSALLTYLGTTGMLGAIAIFMMLWRVSAVVMSEMATQPAALALLFAVMMFSSVEAGLQQMPLSWVLLWIAVGVCRRQREAATLLPWRPGLVRA